MQEGHPTTFESQKLSGAETRYATQEKELLAVIHCLRAWRHYLLGSKFVVKVDNTAASHILTQLKLLVRQARWQEHLAEFDFCFEHKAGKKNQVADTLSQKADMAALRRIAPMSASRVTNDIRELIVENMKKDPQMGAIMKTVESGQSKTFWIENGILMTKSPQMYVPRAGELRQKLLRECHDTHWAGH
ncbi:hypothetical protein HRI_002040700 [Hibiscus trionum]|uniref:Reverse transcriptase RNase H-like domain-containing protein n=1 Tax=Hibiscus trionum TaxID=183268 RepID=A0A9W7HT29_HIBTR|nr:hypothetical protein HRI_002040700 [Hibiscus trionum]